MSLMAHSFGPVVFPSTSTARVSPVSNITRISVERLPAATSPRPDHLVFKSEHVNRRNINLGLALLGLNIVNGGDAKAAGRRPPPSPPKEKQDPNVSGVLAKVLASKKRKEAMKATVAKLKELGKLVDEPSK